MLQPSVVSLKDWSWRISTYQYLFAALVGSLTIGTTFFLSFLVGMLADKIGLRLTSVIGGTLATLGMALSAVGYRRIEVLYVTYGVMFGTGSSLVYTPSLTILGHYFRKRLGVVNGLVTSGSSIFTIGLSFINQYILETHGVGQLSDNNFDLSSF